jgi:hypothetical protein
MASTPTEYEQEGQIEVLAGWGELVTPSPWDADGRPESPEHRPHSSQKNERPRAPCHRREGLAAHRRL